MKLGIRSKKEDGVGVVGCWPWSNASDVLPSSEDMKTNELRTSYPIKSEVWKVGWGEVKSSRNVCSGRDRSCSNGKQYKGQVKR